MSKHVLKTTRDYSQFIVSDTNRSVDSRHIRKLMDSMGEYGWIPAFPMLVHRTGCGMEIIDGQHRFFVAKALGLPVWYVECENGYDVARINRPQCPWKLMDYAENFAKRGVESYAEALEFAEKNGMTIGDAAALLGGTTSYSNIREAWMSGEYQITDRNHAERVAYLYTSLRGISREAVDRAMRLALIAVARVPGIDYRRLVRNAKALPDRLVKYATRDAALDMLEEVYNYRHSGNKYPLKVAAQNAMIARNAVGTK